MLYFPQILAGIGTLPAPLSHSGVLRAISGPCQSKAECGDDVANVLSGMRQRWRLYFLSLSHLDNPMHAEGIPMLIKISPRTEESFRSLTENLLERFDSSESYGLVLRLTHSWKFVHQHFPAHAKARACILT